MFLLAFKWLDGVLNWSPVFKGFIQQFLPALFTIIFFALLPQIITSMFVYFSSLVNFYLAIVKFRGVYSKSELNRGLFRIYFLFLFFNVFLVSLWAGGISF